MIKRIRRVLKDPNKLLLFLLNTKASAIIPDACYLRMKFKLLMGTKLDLKKPVTFNEKLQWLKLNDRYTDYTTMVDKNAVKKHVSDLLGEEIIIPTIGVWDRFDDIDFVTLPEKFVLKCTHDSGSAVICPNKQVFNLRDARGKLENSLKRNYYYPNREWPYKNCKPKIIAEKFMVDESGHDLKDYKIFCFHGEPAFIQVDFDRFTQHKRNLYTTEWNYMDCSLLFPTKKEQQIQKPAGLAQMLKVASKLSNGIKFVRIDLYCINEKIYFGEYTFFPGAGYENFSPDNLNTKFGDMIIL